MTKLTPSSRRIVRKVELTDSHAGLTHPAALVFILKHDRLAMYPYRHTNEKVSISYEELYAMLAERKRQMLAAKGGAFDSLRAMKQAARKYGFQV